MTAPTTGLVPIVLQCDGGPVVEIQFRGKRCWILVQVERAMEYAPGVGGNLIRCEWSAEFVAGTHFDVIEGADLRDLKAVLALTMSDVVSPNARAITVLYEPGLELFILKSDKPVGQRVRAVLVEHRVLGQLAETGRASLGGAAPTGALARSANLRALQQLVDEMVALEAEQHRLAAEQAALAARADEQAAAQEETAARLDLVESRLTTPLPRGTGMIQLAEEAGWRTRPSRGAPAGNPHNLAVITACLNAGFAADARMYRRDERGPDGRLCPTWFLSTRGVADFYAQIDAPRAVGTTFVIEPTEVSRAYGRKERCTVVKVGGAS